MSRVGIEHHAAGSLESLSDALRRALVGRDSALDQFILHASLFDVCAEEEKSGRARILADVFTSAITDESSFRCAEAIRLNLAASGFVDPDFYSITRPSKLGAAASSTEESAASVEHLSSYKLARFAYRFSKFCQASLRDKVEFVRDPSSELVVFNQGEALTELSRQLILPQIYNAALYDYCKNYLGRSDVDSRQSLLLCLLSKNSSIPFPQECLKHPALLSSPEISALIIRTGVLPPDNSRIALSEADEKTEADKKAEADEKIGHDNRLYRAARKYVLTGHTFENAPTLKKYRIKNPAAYVQKEMAKAKAILIFAPIAIFHRENSLANETTKALNLEVRRNKLSSDLEDKVLAFLSREYAERGRAGNAHESLFHLLLVSDNPARIVQNVKTLAVAGLYEAVVEYALRSIILGDREASRIYAILDCNSAVTLNSFDELQMFLLDENNRQYKLRLGFDVPQTLSQDNLRPYEGTALISGLTAENFSRMSFESFDKLVRFAKYANQSALLNARICFNITHEHFHNDFSKEYPLVLLRMAACRHGGFSALYKGRKELGLSSFQKRYMDKLHAYSQDRLMSPAKVSAILSRAKLGASMDALEDSAFLRKWHSSVMAVCAKRDALVAMPGIVQRNGELRFEDLRRCASDNNIRAMVELVYGRRLDDVCFIQLISDLSEARAGSQVKLSTGFVVKPGSGKSDSDLDSKFNLFSLLASLIKLKALDLGVECEAEKDYAIKLQHLLMELASGEKELRKDRLAYFMSHVLPRSSPEVRVDAVVLQNEPTQIQLILKEYRPSRGNEDLLRAAVAHPNSAISDVTVSLLLKGGVINSNGQVLSSISPFEFFKYCSREDAIIVGKCFRMLSFESKLPVDCQRLEMFCKRSAIFSSENSTIDVFAGFLVAAKGGRADQILLMPFSGTPTARALQGSLNRALVRAGVFSAFLTAGRVRRTIDQYVLSVVNFGRECQELPVEEGESDARRLTRFVLSKITVAQDSTPFDRQVSLDLVSFLSRQDTYTADERVQLEAFTKEYEGRVTRSDLLDQAIFILRSKLSVEAQLPVQSAVAEVPREGAEASSAPELLEAERRRAVRYPPYADWMALYKKGGEEAALKVAPEIPKKNEGLLKSEFALEHPLLLMRAIFRDAGIRGIEHLQYALKDSLSNIQKRYLRACILYASKKTLDCQKDCLDLKLGAKLDALEDIAARRNNRIGLLAVMNHKNKLHESMPACLMPTGESVQQVVASEAELDQCVSSGNRRVIIEFVGRKDSVHGIPRFVKDLNAAASTMELPSGGKIILNKSKLASDCDSKPALFLYVAYLIELRAKSKCPSPYSALGERFSKLLREIALAEKLWRADRLEHFGGLSDTSPGQWGSMPPMLHADKYAQSRWQKALQQSREDVSVKSLLRMSVYANFHHGTTGDVFYDLLKQAPSQIAEIVDDFKILLNEYTVLFGVNLGLLDGFCSLFQNKDEGSFTSCYDKFSVFLNCLQSESERVAFAREMEFSYRKEMSPDAARRVLLQFLRAQCRSGLLVGLALSGSAGDVCPTDHKYMQALMGVAASIRTRCEETVTPEAVQVLAAQYITKSLASLETIDGIHRLVIFDLIHYFSRSENTQAAVWKEVLGYSGYLLQPPVKKDYCPTRETVFRAFEPQLRARLYQWLTVLESTLNTDALDAAAPRGADKLPLSFDVFAPLCSGPVQQFLEECVAVNNGESFIAEMSLEKFLSVVKENLDQPIVLRELHKSLGPHAEEGKAIKPYLDLLMNVIKVSSSEVLLPADVDLKSLVAAAGLSIDDRKQFAELMVIVIKEDKTVVEAHEQLLKHLLCEGAEKTREWTVLQESICSSAVDIAIKNDGEYRILFVMRALLPVLRGFSEKPGCFYAKALSELHSKCCSTASLAALAKEMGERTVIRRDFYRAITPHRMVMDPLNDFMHKLGESLKKADSETAQRILSVVSEMMLKKIPSQDFSTEGKLEVCLYLRGDVDAPRVRTEALSRWINLILICARAPFAQDRDLRNRLLQVFAVACTEAPKEAEAVEAEVAAQVEESNVPVSLSKRAVEIIASYVWRADNPEFQASVAILREFCSLPNCPVKRDHLMKCIKAKWAVTHSGIFKQGRRNKMGAALEKELSTVVHATTAEQPALRAQPSVLGEL